ncbi:transcriptional regulator LytR [Paenibacillus sp. J23TS9]|uniref:LCP family glycopolymer transferase n=1 Tax=Paenibacillus sp. J23TS9 TaxID=2807193 RepID=UPI001AFF8B27|nr:LCP family protein [Paenibacillus sp. J23TS9]GIP29614.1 transcriptional regulator LytR [Paenibacillus sp. J23TS9]
MKKWVVILTSAFVVVVLGVAGYAAYIYQSVKTTAHQIYESRDAAVQPKPVSKEGNSSPNTAVTSTGKDASVQPSSVKTTVQPINLEEKKPFTVLVLGVDQRENDRGRSDSMIFLTVNPAKQSILMFNIPRDTRTEIVGHGTVDKINHAYAFGGVSMSVKTVEHFLDYPVNYYIKVNMEGFAHLIDSMGGVEVNNPFSFYYEGHQFDQGDLNLNGEEALLYSRMRYDDPRGDMGRNTRQRQILNQVIKNSLKITNVVKIESLLSDVGDSVKTDITFDDMKAFLTNYRTDLKEIEQVEISGEGERIKGIWYYSVSDKERSRIHNLIKEHLQ